MRAREIIRSGITTSAVAHLSALVLLLLFTEVHPFGAVTAAEPLTVDLVSPAEAVQAPNHQELNPKQELASADAIEQSSNSGTPGAPPSPAGAPQKQAALSTPSLDRQEIAVAPQGASPAYTPPEPDLSIKYHVLLGLPLTSPVAVATGGSYFDAAASERADVNSTLISEFRRHLKTCSKLPASIAPSDKVRITLRAFMTPQGRLAMDPLLIEASASAKGPALMQSAIDALKVCQPYAMLPADRYGEWKVLDLSFTPRDFAGAS
jgi:hypothetical protein